MERKDGPVYCDCCGTVKIAEYRDGKLVIVDRQHGRKHVGVLVLDNYLRPVDTDKREPTT